MGGGGGWLLANFTATPFREFRTLIPRNCTSGVPWKAVNHIVFLHRKCVVFLHRPNARVTPLSFPVKHGFAAAVPLKVIRLNDAPVEFAGKQRHKGTEAHSEEVSKELQKYYKKYGINVLTKTRVLSAKANANGAEVKIQKEDGTLSVGANFESTKDLVFALYQLDNLIRSLVEGSAGDSD